MPFHPFETFLQEFTPQVARKSTQLNKAVWLLETTGSSDAADLKAELDAELRLIFHDKEIYQKLNAWLKDPTLKDPLLKRQCLLLFRSFQQNQIEKSLVIEIAKKEAALAQSYASFRPTLEGKSVSENDIREILKKETNIPKRKKAYEASKKIGAVLAPQILELVSLRNKSAKLLGFSDYFQMQLEMQEVDRKWLLSTFDALAKGSEIAYSQMRQKMDEAFARRFHCSVKELGAWSWSDPFGQEDSLDSQELDALVEKVDIAQVSASFYKRMGIDVGSILLRSDMHERPGKNQHAFCIHIDREGDVRTLNNVKSSLKWLETVLHELGHGIYELGLDPALPWLLKEPPHMITTEAMALIAGRQAYKAKSLEKLVGKTNKPLLQRVDESLARRQLIFSRWVLVMSTFESELYRNPSQDLNALWWELVQKYQQISPPSKVSERFDWACKYHLGLAPVYYFSYLLGEMFASAIQEKLASHCLDSPEAGSFLKEKLFHPGNLFPWDALIIQVTGKPLTPDAWIREFC